MFTFLGDLMVLEDLMAIKTQGLLLLLILLLLGMQNILSKMVLYLFSCPSKRLIMKFRQLQLEGNEWAVLKSLTFTSFLVQLS